MEANEISTTPPSSDVAGAEQSTTDRTNGGENDQTGGPLAHYGSITLEDSTIVTCDMSRAHPFQVELHKLFIHSGRSGDDDPWRKYKHAATIDWTSHSSVENLNKWREQTFRRGNWPAKRSEQRVDYTDEEQVFLYDFIERAEGNKPKESLADITTAFNAKFVDQGNEERQRTETGIAAAVTRLRRRYTPEGMTPRKQRGWNKKVEAAKGRSKEAEEDDDE